MEKETILGVIVGPLVAVNLVSMPYLVAEYGFNLAVAVVLVYLISKIHENGTKKKER